MKLYNITKYIKLTIILIITLNISNICSSSEKKNEPIEIKKIWSKYVDKNIIDIKIYKKEIIITTKTGKIISLKKNKRLKLDKKFKKKIQFGIENNKKLKIITTKKNSIIAINNKNKQVIWKKKFEEKIISPPKLTNKYIIINTYGNKITILNSINGVTLWKYITTGNNIISKSNDTTLVSKKNIYTILSNGKIIAINKINNKIIWNKKLYQLKGTTEYKKLTKQINKPILDNNFIYSSNYNGELVKIETKNGCIIWKKFFKEPIKFTINKKNIFILTNKGNVISINKKNGEKEWINKEIKINKLKQPLLIKKSKLMLIFDDNGTLYILDKHNGNIITKSKIIKDFLKEPLIYNNKIFFIEQNGHLTCMEINKK